LFVYNTHSCKGFDDKKQAFADKLKYVAGAYDDFKAYLPLDVAISQIEENFKASHRLFYFAIPPSIFVAVSKAAKLSCMAKVCRFFFLRIHTFIYSQAGLELSSKSLLARIFQAINFSPKN
jgi:hypothetical protein